MTVTWRLEAKDAAEHPTRTAQPRPPGPAAPPVSVALRPRVLSQGEVHDGEA